jgi:M6 family metalloprotease-like protein
MKRFALILLVGLLWGCSPSKMDYHDTPRVTDSERIDGYSETEIESTTAKEPDGPTITYALVGEQMPEGAYGRIMNAFNRQLDWYSLLNVDVLSNYETVYIFYNAQLEQKLRSFGFDWPEIGPYEVISQIRDSTTFVFINFRETKLQNKALDRFLKSRFSFDHEVTQLIPKLSRDASSIDLLASYEICQVPHDPQVKNEKYEMIMGFPRPPLRLPNDRDIKAIVIFVDFPEHPSTKSIDELNSFFEELYVGFTNEYIDSMSYGRVQHEFHFHDRVVRTNLRGGGPLEPWEDSVNRFMRIALQNADPQIDFSPYDYVIVHTDPNLPLSFARFGWMNIASQNRGFVTAEKTFHNVIALSAITIQSEGNKWIGAHEVMHMYGLIDYYSYPNEVWRGDEWVGSFDLMSRAMGRNNELLLWSRWFIGWVTANDIECIDARTPIIPTQHILNSTMGADGVKGLIVRISEYELLLIERKDYNDYCQSCKGGLLVTSYSSSTPAMYGPLRIVRPQWSVDPDFEDAFLNIGDVMEVGRDSN